VQDGVNVWPLLIEPPAPTNYSAAHEALVLSKEVVIVGQHKLIIAQNFGWPPVNGWRQLDGSWIQSQGNTDNTSACLIPDLAPNNQTYLGGLPGKTPCLFDIRCAFALLVCCAALIAYE